MWAPMWADELDTRGGPLRRRGASLVSRWLTGPLCIAGPEDAASSDAPLKHKRPLTMILAFAVDADEPRPLLSHHSDDVRFASTPW